MTETICKPQNIVSIKNYTDVSSRSKFRPSIDIRDNPLIEILGDYKFPQSRKCGISTCHSPHNKGFLARVENGYEILIGHTCGFNHFGVLWTEKKAQFKRIQNTATYKDRIRQCQKDVPALITAVHALNVEVGCEGDAYECMKWMHKAGLPEEIWEKLSIRSRTNDAIISKVRMAANKEEAKREAAIAKETRSELAGRTTTAYIIRGISAVRNYQKLKIISSGELLNKIDRYSYIDIDELSFEELRKKAKWASEIDSNITTFAEIIDECRRFLAQSNIDSIRGHRHLL